MAGRKRESRPDLIQELLESAEEFEFFQAVRLIERAVGERRVAGPSGAIGEDHGMAREPVRFRALPSLTFPAGQISSVRSGASGRGSDADPESSPHPLTSRVDMMVPFLGLTGPNGALPAHYTSLLIERSHLRLKDYALQEFFDLFNHRVISLFYRAWEKYRFCIAYERSAAEGGLEEDLFTECLRSLVGIGLPGLRRQFSFDDHALLFYGGIYAQQTRNAMSLQLMLTEYIGIPTVVEQFIGQWLYLPDDMQTAMPSAVHPQGMNTALGAETVVGSRVWDIQTRFRIRIGPLRWAAFHSLLPGTPQLTCLAEMIRFYAGIEFDFDVQLILHAKDIPSCRLTRGGDQEPRLGWTTWIGDRSQSGQDADDPVFVFRYSASRQGPADSSP